jgi:hypothetical protein
MGIDRSNAVSQWETFEIRLTGPREGNPFSEVALSALFRLGGRSVECPGFYDGDGSYAIRFLADRQGEWRYETRSNSAELDGKSGTVKVGPAAPGERGPVRVCNQYHFAYEDGTPYRPFGTTAYAWIHQPAVLEARTLASLARSPFNKLRMCVFPKHYDYNANEPELYPFEGSLASGWDWSRPNPAFFRHLEERILDLAALGIETDLILFHPYDRWGFSSMPAWADDAYLRYLVARLAALPNLWWSMANEYDLFAGKSVPDWERLARVVMEGDPWGHLRSIHNCAAPYDHNRSWITHVSMQRTDVHKTSENVAEWRERWRKPVVVDECAYEGDINWGWGNITAQEMVRRCWEGAVRGGYVGHGETYLNEREELWWSKGGELVGESPARIAFLRAVLESGPKGGIDPLALGGGYWDLPVGGKAGEYYLFYFGISRPRFRVIDLPEDRRFKVDVIDSWDMTVSAVPGTHSGRLRLDLPAKQFMAIRAEAV